jgi:tetratricopeptide (TPR) repeat protein
VLGENHHDHAGFVNLLARVVEGRGDMAEAETLYRRALEIATRSLGDSHYLVGTTWNDLGFFYLRIRRLDESDRHYRQAIRIYAKELGEEHPWTNFARRNHAAVLLERGEAGEAEAVLRRGLELPDDRQYRAPLYREMSEFLLGASLVDQGRYEEGKRLLERHREALESEYGASFAAVYVKAGLKRLAMAEAQGG